MKKWFKTGALRHAPAGSIDEGKGIIEGVSVCTVGEAKGHGVYLDPDFISSVVELGNKTKSGLKARFGHPNMCDTALGTFLGRFKNFRTVGDTAKADLFLSNTAKETPNGDLYSYITSMAVAEPDMFGTSIVFEPGEQYQLDEDGDRVAVGHFDDSPVYVTCDSLHACDVVDEPAANSGMFSSFSGDTLAGRITQFFSDNPGVFHALTENPDVIQALAEHADELAPFIDKYTASLAIHTITKKPEKPKMKDASDDVKEVEDVQVEETASVEDVEVAEDSADEAPQDDGEAANELSEEKPECIELAEEKNTAEPVDEEPKQEVIELAAFSKAVKEFGSEIAAKAFTDGGGYDEAQQAYYAGLKAENIRLRESVETAGANPGEFSAEPVTQTGLAGLFSK